MTWCSSENTLKTYQHLLMSVSANYCHGSVIYNGQLLIDSTDIGHHVMELQHLVRICMVRKY
jgi:hypothetical protein